MQPSIINNQQPSKYALLTMAAILAIVIAPLLLALSWGPHFAHDVYETLQAVRNLLGVTDPLFIVPAPIALIVSAAGWSVVGIAYLMIGWQWKRPFSTAISTVLLSFNPFIIITLGSQISWILALFWLAVALGLMHRWLLSIFVFLGLILLLWVAWPSNGTAVWALGWTLFLFLAVIGAEWVVARLAARDEIEIRLGYQRTSAIILSIVFLGVGIWQIINITSLYQTRPFSQWQLEQEIADWLQAETNENTILLAPAKIGYLAQRLTVSSLAVSEQATASALIEVLQLNPPDYLVGSNNMIWKNMEENLWFRLAYEPIQTFHDHHNSTAPYTIWAYRPPKFGQDKRVSVNVRVPDRLRLLGYEMTPTVVQSGESVEMTFYLQTLAATAVSLTPFAAIIRLVSPVDNATITEWQIDLPQTISVANWQPGQRIVEQFSLPIPENMEPGGYLLNLSLTGTVTEEEGLWPFSRDNDIKPLDRIPLGSIAVPKDDSLTGSEPLAITFANSIQLNGFSTNEPQSGENLDVTLFWQADEPTVENYVVFVHLLDENGQLMTNHDGVPGNGRFPTTTWQSGIIIQDNHTLPLPPNMPPGTYRIKVGLYQPETGDRLPLTNSTDEEALHEKALTLMQFQIP